MNTEQDNAPNGGSISLTTGGTWDDTQTSGALNLTAAYGRAEGSGGSVNITAGHSSGSSSDAPTGVGTPGAVNITSGGSSTVQGLINTNGPIKLNTDPNAIGQPAAAAGYRGVMWFTPGASLTADKLELCIKDATDTYVWKTVTLT